MKYIITLNGNTYEVEVEKGQATATYVGKAEDTVAAIPTPAPAPESVKEKPAAAHNVAAGAGDPIKAPMPGTILKVNAKAGQPVKAGDILFILEAMKMENEIVAPRDGNITSVMVDTNASVETDAILATIQ